MIKALPTLTTYTLAEVGAAFDAAASESTLTAREAGALRRKVFAALEPEWRSNRQIKMAMRREAQSHGFDMTAPPTGYAQFTPASRETGIHSPWFAVSDGTPRGSWASAGDFASTRWFVATIVYPSPLRQHGGPGPECVVVYEGADLVAAVAAGVAGMADA